MVNKSTSYFALARTALKYGLKTLNLSAGDRVMVPDYMCDVVFAHLQEFGLKIITYQISDNFVPDWDNIESIVKNKSIRALFFAHYFGQPQEINHYLQLSSEYNLLLLEDNSHGHGGRLKDQPLGTFGDIGISSPRKILGLSYGGLLYYPPHSSLNIDKVRKLPISKLGYFNQKIKIGLNYFPRIKGRIKGGLNIAINWSDPHLFREKLNPDYQIDSYSLRRIISADWQCIARQRRTIWNKWLAFTSNNGIKPVFSSVHPESCPWALPAYVQNMDERNHWLKWGAKHGINIFPWPTLTEKIINENGPALSRWKRLLCFPLDVEP